MNTPFPSAKSRQDGSAPLDETFVLVSPDHKAACIVTGHQPPPSVAFAARELQSYIRRITGTEPRRAEEAEPGTPSILLGEAARKRLPAEELQTVRRDGYLIKIQGGDLCVTGIDEDGPRADVEALLAKGVTDVAAWTFQRGTLYGVYRLLEALGVRWYMPGNFGERVPRRTRLDFAGKIAENPHFISRYIAHGHLYGDDLLMPGEWEALGFTPSEDRLWQLRMRCASFKIPLNHYPNRTSWVERFAASHPEYFALQSDGTRDLSERDGRYYQLCYSNPGVVRESVADVRAFAAGKHPRMRGIRSVKDEGSAGFPYNNGWPENIALDGYFSLLPHDKDSVCTCPECARLMVADADGREGEERLEAQCTLKSRLVWHYLAACAEKVLDTDILVTCLAYHSYSRPYPGMKKLPPNVVVGICAYPYMNPTSLYYGDNMARYEQLLRQWAELTDHPLAFWQHYLSSNRRREWRGESVGVPEHIPDWYAGAVRLMARYGNHAYGEMRRVSYLFELYNRYLLLKLFYDPNLDEQALWEDFLAGFYGPDAGPILGGIYADIRRKTQERIRRHGESCDTTMLIDNWTRLYPAQVLRSYRARAAEAQAKAQGTPYVSAVEAFDRYYLGLMEYGRERFFSSEAGKALQAPNPEWKCARAANEMVVDGTLDAPAWRSAASMDLYDAANGEKAAPLAEARACHDGRLLYFGVSGAFQEEALRGEERVEVFIDTDRDRPGYYQLILDLEGRVEGRHYHNRLSLDRESISAWTAWDSRTQCRVTRQAKGYVMQIAIPLAALGLTEIKPASARNIGVLLGQRLPTAGGMRAFSTSAVLRDTAVKPSVRVGAHDPFHQPPLFNRFSLADPNG